MTYNPVAMRTARPLALLALCLPAALAAEPVPTRRPMRRAPEPLCTARLVVRQTDGASGCFIDERVTGAPGELRYPCGGGPATATFRNGRFAGRVEADGTVSLALATSFPFSDGCRWRSAQAIDGRLASGRLAFRYTEAPAPGQRGCASPCRATGEVEVLR